MVRKRGRAYRSSYWDRNNKIWSGLWSIYTFEKIFNYFPFAYFPVQIETDWEEIMHKN